MSDLAERHRRIAAVVERLERMGVEAEVDGHGNGGEQHLTLDLHIPPTLDPVDGGDTTERVEDLEAECERLREQRDGLEEDIGDLEAALATDRSSRRAGDEDDASEEHPDDGTDAADATGDREAATAGNGRAEAETTGVPNDDLVPAGDDGDPDADDGERPPVDQEGLTDGERETLRAVRRLGASSSSGEIADEVDATLQSVRSWLPNLVNAGLVRTTPDPTDGRRKHYSPVEGAGSPDEEDDADETVYIASNGGSPSQVFHVRADCPQLQKSTDSVEKDRSVVPHHRPCGNCVPAGLDEGLVAIAKGSTTTTYHKREDCPKLGSAITVSVQEHETVPDYDPCDDCVPQGDTDAEGDDERPDGPTAAGICAENDLRRDDVATALATSNAVYQVRRELGLSEAETVALLRDLGVYEDLDGGGHVATERAQSVAREHVPPARKLGSGQGGRR